MSIVRYFCFLQVEDRTLSAYLVIVLTVLSIPWIRGKGRTSFSFLFPGYYSSSFSYYCFAYFSSDGFFFFGFGGAIHHFSMAKRTRNYKNCGLQKSFTLSPFFWMGSKLLFYGEIEVSSSLAERHEYILSIIFAKVTLFVMYFCYSRNCWKITSDTEYIPLRAG